MSDRRAKIVATLGPATRDAGVLRALLETGADVVRLNLSHGEHGEHRAAVEQVRRIAAELGRHVAVLADLAGPRYRLGELPPEGRVLRTGESVVVGPEGQGADVPVGRADLIGLLEAGERLLVDGGVVELRVEERRSGSAVATVTRGGVVTSRKGLNLPETKMPFEVTAKDRRDIAFAVQAGVDLLGASYVSSAGDIGLLRDALRAEGAALPIVAKIERPAAMERIDEIVGASDAVMVARGDLGVEVPFEQVPVLQKRILAAGRTTATPVIVATDMLASMIDRERPTRAEVSDVAHAVFDGADALMLSGETAIGRHPVAAVEAMARTIRSAEAHERRDRGEALGLSAKTLGGDLPGSTSPGVPDAVAAAAARVAELLEVRAIVAFTQTGSTARLMARYRPSIPIIAFAPDDRVARLTQLVWGIEPHVIPAVEHHEDIVALIDRELLRIGRARAGDQIVVLMGAPVPERPRTNLMRIHRVGGRSGRTDGGQT